MPVQTQIQTRRGTAASWTSTNPTLAAGEIGFETDTGRFKIGTGSTAWAALGYATTLPSTYTAKGDILVATAAGTVTNQAVGSNNQVLMADSAQSDGVKWANEATATLTAKGDLLSASAANTLSRLAVGSNGDTLVADSSTSTGLRWQQPKTQNALYNSSFDIWQRGTSFNGSAPYYCADRWFFARPGAAAGSTVSRQSAGLTGFNYCARMQRDNGNTSTLGVRLFQSLETADSIYFAGKTVTLSFYVRSGANYSGGNGTYINLYSGTGTDQQLGNTGFTGVVSIALSSPITPTSTWTRYSVTGTVSSSATEIGFEIGYNPTGTAGANDYIEVTGFQLEVGSVATPYTRQNATLAGELAACQRYYWRQTADATAVYALLGAGPGLSTFNVGGLFQNPVAMRTAASSVDFSTLQVNDGVTIYAVTGVTLATQRSSSRASSVDLTTGGTLTATRYYNVGVNNSSTGFIGFSAEL